MLKLAWWNTSLSPNSKTRASVEDFTFALCVIAALVNSEGISIFCLGEVTEEDVLGIIKALQGVGSFDYHMGRNEVGLLKFDTAVIYRSDVFEVATSRTHTSRHADTNTKIAEFIGFRVRSLNEYFGLFVCHWNSRIRSPEDASIRDSYGQDLHAATRDIIVKGIDRIVIAGDFNDDPFSKPLAEKLLATRDKGLAMKNNEYFYNPFWRHLSWVSDADSAGHLLDCSGTHYYLGRYSRWHTFDQVIVSSACLQTGWLTLEESESGVYASEEMIEKVISQSIFDHLPIVAKFSGV